MSIHKIFALIGSVIYSFIPICLLLSIKGDFSVGSISSVASGFIAGFSSGGSQVEWTAISPDQLEQYILIFLIILTVITTIFAILNWLAFVKLDGPREDSWRQYWLIIGILTIIFSSLYAYFPIVSGILFILIFAF